MFDIHFRLSKCIKYWQTGWSTFHELSRNIWKLLKDLLAQAGVSIVYNNVCIDMLGSDFIHTTAKVED